MEPRSDRPSHASVDGSDVASAKGQSGKPTGSGDGVDRDANATACEAQTNVTKSAHSPRRLRFRITTKQASFESCRKLL